MVIVMPGKKYQLDFVTLTSVHYCLKRCGGPPLVYNDKINFSQVDKLGIVGHGSPGGIEGKPADTFTKVIISGPNGVTKGRIQKIVITSCYAGLPIKPKKMGPNKSEVKAVIDVFAEALTSKGITGISISGAIGPSIKADALGDKFRVVMPRSKSRKTAGDQQTGLLDTSDYGFLKDLKVTPDVDMLEYQAQFAAEVTHAFFKEFIEKLDKKSKVLASDNIAMRTVIS